MKLKNNGTAPPPLLAGVLRSLWQWRKPIVITTLVGGLLAAIVSLLLPVYYQSTTSFLAVNPDLNTIDNIFGNSNGRIGIYGGRDDIDRLLAIAESDELLSHLVETFDLYGVYEIDSTNTKSAMSVRRELLNNYQVVKTPRNTLELSVMDKDPERAAEMARSAREKISDISVNIITANHRRIYNSLGDEVKTREQRLADINASLKEIRSSSGVYNTEVQGEVLSTLSSSLENDIATTESRIESYRQRNRRADRDSIAKLEISLASLTSSRITLDTQLTRFNENLGPINALEERRTLLSNAVSYDRLRLTQYERLLATQQRALEVVEEARVPVVKAKPVRSLIVLGGLIFSFLTAVIGVLIFESGRRYDWKSIFQ
ncbi:hypothetical protein [Lewinella sp. 4G2]|uniref:hypothetical protein n=1 Tax=Lewinella sp. 4G2 TaxID=1803372 RepID=UPI0007B4649E|nr:hypothetical protein [Lewinella sp. 4G2]OAV43022.1 hypothetical protein A3850_000235 [Lewinella sp. 4G2]